MLDGPHDLDALTAALDALGDSDRSALAHPESIEILQRQLSEDALARDEGMLVAQARSPVIPVIASAAQSPPCRRR